ncbi:hypothetical protein ACTO4W_27990, partial [Klebsiella michiganensis]
MTITETQKTAQLAADAAVSAAEAKQYMLEAEQGYQDTSAAAQQAQDAAGSALLSKQSAATSEENSLQYATEAGVARDEAVTAASNASEYALNKFTFYKTPSDPDGTIAGLAATTDGQSFWVAQGPDALSAAWQYQNNAGVAVLQAKQPGTAAITGTIREFPTLAAAQADADAGNISVGSTAYYRSPDDSALAIEVMNVGGTLEATGLRMISKEYVDALVDAIYERIKPLQSSPDALFDIVSRNGLRLFKIDDDNGETSLSLIARLLTGDSGLNFSGNILDNNAPEGWLFLIYAKNGLVIAGVKEDGTKVGWGGSDSGGGQAGGITPGDTAVGYDDIRNYTGDATVRDVVGERIGGRFVVDASDTSSPDDGGG